MEAGAKMDTGLTEILAGLKAARQRNIAVYARMAELVPYATTFGFRIRKPGDVDVTMWLVERALENDPVAARALISEVNDNDEEIMRLGKLLE